MTSTEPLTFADRWVVKGTIGKGAFSEIYAATDKHASTSSDLVAIKFHNADFDSSVMKWESIVMSELASIPSVPKLIHYGNEHGRDYLVMELLTGEDMAQLRDRSRYNLGSKFIPIEVASFLTRQMIRCLESMHRRGYVHRDVKPSNFVRRSANSTEFCVIDFGLAKQHRDTQGRLRAERENVDFRGTTIYASPFVHTGHDQCPRDDIFSVLHVFLDLVLGDLPWRLQAKTRDKAAVAAVKQRLLEDPGTFLTEFVDWQVNSMHADAEHVAELRSIVEKISPSVCRFVKHLKGLGYADLPDYELLTELLKQPIPQDVTDAAIADLSYTSYGFNWNDGKNLQEVMHKFQQQANGATGREGNNSAYKGRKSVDLRDRMSVEGMNENHHHTLNHAKNATTSSNKGFTLKVHAHAQGSSVEHRLLNLHDKLLVLQSETESFRAAQAAVLLTSLPAPSSSAMHNNSNGSGGGNNGLYWNTSASPEAAATSSFATTATTSNTSAHTLAHTPAITQASANKLGLEVAVRWRNLTRELIKLPETALSTTTAFDTLTLCYQVLLKNEHFYGVNLGDLDAQWSEFVEVQTTAAAFYEVFASIHRNRSTALDDLLAGLGGGDSNGAALNSAPLGDLNDVDKVETGVEAARASVRDDCSSQASMPSVPVSAAVSAATSTADLHAQDVDGENDETKTQNEENGEVDLGSDGPSMKRSRHE